MNQEFPAGSRWRSRGWSRTSVIVYGETAGLVAYRSAHDERPMLLTAAAFRDAFECIDGVRCTTCGGRGHV
jgi:hypothetical protein